MTFKSKFLTIPVGGLLLSSYLLACGGEGGRLGSVRGEICSENAKPVHETLQKGETDINLDPDAGKIKNGDYVYQGADLYYVDSKTDLRVHLVDFKNEKSGYSSQVKCFRNLQPGMKGVQFEIEGISRMRVNSTDKQPFVDIHQYTFSLTEKQIANRAKPLQSKVQGSPKDIYLKSNTVRSVQFVHISGDDYEIRSTGRSADGRGTYALGIKLKRKKL